MTPNRYDVSPYEHNAVARTLHKVEKEKRVKIYILPVDTETYEIDLEKTKYAFVKNKPDYIFDALEFFDNVKDTTMEIVRIIVYMLLTGLIGAVIRRHRK